MSALEYAAHPAVSGRDGPANLTHAVVATRVSWQPLVLQPTSWEDLPRTSWRWMLAHGVSRLQ